MVIYLFASNSLMLLWQISNYMILEVCFVFLFLFFITFYSFLCWGMCLLVEMRDNLWGAVLFFQRVRSRNRAQSIRLGSEHSCPLRQIASPMLSFSVNFITMPQSRQTTKFRDQSKPLFENYVEFQATRSHMLD